ncbi:MAG TPA: MEDS domain-containing protein [Rhizomicrobium sp.]|jgi:DNA-binding CsgD family transcriptional regulator|nr:MEDS domain-containing protein [Rhizomicrobium sp.]
MKSPRADGRIPVTAHKRRPIALWSKPDCDDSLRDTGIGVIGKIPWGTHICLFCETKKDLLEAACACFAPARHVPEQCIWVVSDPLTVDEAVEALRAAIPEFDSWRRSGRFKLLPAAEWYYDGGRFDWQHIVKAWHRLADEAVKDGLAGLRAFGNPIWRRAQIWSDIVEYEHALEATLAGRRIIMLCAYMIGDSRPEDVFDVACNHQCVIARRSGHWQFLEVPAAKEAQHEIRLLNGDLAVLPEPFANDASLTDRERVVLAQLLRGASSKQAARILGISPRTVDFHRANMMQKLGARNTAELIGKVLAAAKSDDPANRLDSGGS